MSEIVEQLRSELQGRLDIMRSVATPEANALHEAVCDRLEDMMETKPLAALSVIRMLCQQPGWWWRTPLGMWCASQMAADNETLSNTQAADMLGIDRGQLYELMGVIWMDLETGEESEMTERLIDTPGPNKVTARSVYSLLAQRVADEGPGQPHNPYKRYGSRRS